MYDTHADHEDDPPYFPRVSGMALAAPGFSAQAKMPLFSRSSGLLRLDDVSDPAAFAEVVLP